MKPKLILRANYLFTCMSLEYITAFMKKITSPEFQYYTMIDLAKTFGVKLSDPLDSDKIGTRFQRITKELFPDIRSLVDTCLVKRIFN